MSARLPPVSNFPPTPNPPNPSPTPPPTPHSHTLAPLPAASRGRSDVSIKGAVPTASYLGLLQQNLHVAHAGDARVLALSSRHARKFGHATYTIAATTIQRAVWSRVLPALVGFEHLGFVGVHCWAPTHCGPCHHAHVLLVLSVTRATHARTPATTSLLYYFTPKT
jgi:hypothetical protein